MVYKTISLFIGIIGSLYLFSISPNKSRKAEMKILEKQCIAHRGLFDNESDAPENSIPAFQRAVRAGYGIELDVQVTADNQLVVFHDETLKRMCGVNKKLTDCSYNELCKYKLNKSDEPIPLLENVLKVIDGKVPLVIEVKPEGNWKKTTQLTAEMMDTYKGYYCMESFHPFAVKWFKDHRPDIVRGQLSTNYFGDHINRSWYEKFLLTNLMLNCISKPDFIAYNHLWKNNVSYTLCRKLFPVKNIAWTIKNQEELDRAYKTFDAFIFDSFLPKTHTETQRR